MNEISNVVPSNLMGSETRGPQAKQGMGKEDFLKLLMTQLRHQDPLRPMDHHEFATQLAQFSSLEQLTNIGAGINGLRTGMGEESKLQALGMIGKNIHTSGNEINMMEGQPIALRHTSNPNLQPVKAMIFDSSNKLVREMNLAGNASGDEITWDGKNQEGKFVPSGKYTFRVHGASQNGQAQEISTELSGRVTGVVMEGSDTLLIVETGKGQVRVAMKDVKRVSSDQLASDKPQPIKSQPIRQAQTPATSRKIELPDNLAGRSEPAELADEAEPEQDAPDAAEPWDAERNKGQHLLLESLYR